MVGFLKAVKTGLVKGGHFIKRNAPTILTVAAVGGSVSSVVFAVKATPKALKLIEERKKKEEKAKLTVLETADACWKVYVPAAIALTAAVGCIIGANCASLKQQAAILGLYSAQGEMIKEYKKKVKDVIGEEQEASIDKEMMREKLGKDPRFDHFQPVKPGEFPIYDDLTGQILSGTRAGIELKIAQAKNIVYEKCTLSLNDWLDLIGGRPVKDGWDRGWDERDGFQAHVRTVELNEAPIFCIEYDVIPHDPY